MFNRFKYSKQTDEETFTVIPSRSTQNSNQIKLFTTVINEKQ